ncbi:SDR family oxidoreductase [Allokutzneria oryzae]|uniref:SDR family oxidoreductase n=1 Tax=Allokutzneria oryzae TaxID=1378989 RepID=A0ABV5ZVU8_9PSEU
MSTILVTGAAGLVGSEVVARLVKSGHKVLALVHRQQVLHRNSGAALCSADVTLVPGDVTKPRLGLPARIASTVDKVVHCAAITDFGRSKAVYQSVNVDGTTNVVELAAGLGVPLVHVGTAYVCGERDGVALESDLDVGQRFANAYEESKLQAETLVHKARADGLAAAVVRPSIVVGAERTGVVRDFKNLYVVLKLTTEGKVRSIPGHYDANLDLVPVDYVADLTVEVAERFSEAEGKTFHAVGKALTLRDFSDVLAEYPSFGVPRFVPPSSFDAQRLPMAERMYYERVASLYESYFQRRVHFDTSTTDAFRRRKAPSGGPAYLRRLLDHCLKVGYLGAPLPSVTEVLSGLDGGS